jgi:hypothetical protein
MAMETYRGGYLLPRGINVVVRIQAPETPDHGNCRDDSLLIVLPPARRSTASRTAPDLPINQRPPGPSLSSQVSARPKAVITDPAGVSARRCRRIVVFANDAAAVWSASAVDSTLTADA